MLKLFFTTILALSLSSNVLGADVLTHTGKVTRVVAFPHSYGSYDETQKGRLAIYVEGLPQGCGSELSRVVVGVDHPIHDSVLSLALMAIASQAEVKVAYFDQCTVRSDSWDLAYFNIN
ncbi:hypothetical protein ACJJIK_16635 [Microbulbifer sp. ZKSA006]|uniref:hypothetical protein n=1 Tax=Microbulbifer sp. ZKSA006 TaxID=3243390 RepID=UPI004039DF65